MHTFLVIARNATIILGSLTLFAALGVLVSVWLSDNSHEPQPTH